MSTALSALKPGQTGVVLGFVEIDDVALRLMQMGMIEGTVIEVIRYAPAGDPMEIRVLGYALSLRAEEAAKVLVSDVA